MLLGKDYAKVMIDHKTLLEGRERTFIYCQGDSIEIDIGFSQLRGKWSTGRVIPFIWRAIYVHSGSHYILMK